MGIHLRELTLLESESSPPLPEALESEMECYHLEKKSIKLHKMPIGKNIKNNICVPCLTNHVTFGYPGGHSAEESKHINSSLQTAKKQM